MNTTRFPMLLIREIFNASVAMALTAFDVSADEIN